MTDGVDELEGLVTSGVLFATTLEEDSEGEEETASVTSIGSLDETLDMHSSILVGKRGG